MNNIDKEEAYASWLTRYKSSMRSVEHKLEYLAQHWYDSRDSAIPRDIELETDSIVAIQISQRKIEDIKRWIEIFKGGTGECPK